MAENNWTHDIYPLHDQRVLSLWTQEKITSIDNRIIDTNLHISLFLLDHLIIFSKSSFIMSSHKLVFSKDLILICQDLHFSDSSMSNGPRKKPILPTITTQIPPMPAGLVCWTLYIDLHLPQIGWPPFLLYKFLLCPLTLKPPNSPIKQNRP